MNKAKKGVRWKALYVGNRYNNTLRQLQARIENHLHIECNSSFYNCVHFYHVLKISKNCWTNLIFTKIQWALENVSVCTFSPGAVVWGVMKLAVKRTSTGVDRRPGRRPVEKGSGRRRPCRKRQAGRHRPGRKRQWSLSAKLCFILSTTAFFYWSTSTILHFSSSRRRPSRSTTAFFSVDSRQPFSSRPWFGHPCSITTVKSGTYPR